MDEKYVLAFWKMLVSVRLLETSQILLYNVDSAPRNFFLLAAH